MLSKKHRLPIQRAPAKNFKFVKSPVLSVKIFNSNLPYPRFGVIISKKINKLASGRNKLKRLVFLFFQEKLNKFRPADYLVIINKKEISGDELIKELINNLPANV